MRPEVSDSVPGEGSPLDLAVVILNYNGGPLLVDVVTAALGDGTLRIGVVVVDNSSNDGSMDQLAAAPAGRTPAFGRGPVLCLRSDRNLGFAGGNNLGMFGLQARYVALLNNDALVDPGTLPTLVAFMDRCSRVGACAPRLVWPDGRPQPFSYGADPAPGYLMRRARARRRGHDLHDWGPGVPRSVEWVAGTCMVLRPAALAQVGLLDEGIFMYFEDNDLCLRLRQRGWQVSFVPEVAVRHFNRPSYADGERVARYYRGLAHFYRKHYGVVPGAIVSGLGRLRARLRR